jgi:hypothetical protein
MEALIRSYKDYNVNETISILHSQMKKVFPPDSASIQTRRPISGEWPCIR